MTSPFFDHPYLSGHHEPNRFEADAPDLIIKGELPDDLEGVFYRNGAEPLYPPLEGDYHWFDGDGMIYGFFIANGKVGMRNRWVRTDKFNLELDAGKRLFGLFGNPMTSDPASEGTRYNTANTNIILHGGKLLALMEGAPAVEMDPRSLETIGEDSYGGAITTTFSAHPKIDHFNGEMVNLGAMINGAMGKPEIRYDVISKSGEITKTEFFDVPHMAPMHTFLLSENWVVFPVTPIDVSVERAQAGGPMTAWMPNRSVKLGIMPRNGTPDQMRWLEMEPRHMYHELNVWEEGDTLFADVATANGTPLFPDEDGNRLTHEEAAQSLRRWEIDLSGKSDSVKETVLNDRDIQFPRPDDRFMTRKTSQSFANINLNSKDGRVDGMDAVLRFDTATGKEDIYHFGNGTAAGELIFAPRKGAADEADGYAMTLIHPANSPTSELVVFAANDIAGGPIARVIIPFRISSGFHCNYYSADSDLYTSAFD
ncbi:carotenoid oxygenase family protein [Parasphingorhabdus sp.]|uniref:carotenoid oxygenase family protein n=1 Tax=Parasphingorhabdus sp. TaxID=2709688 RepID=UPI003266F148